MASAPESSAWSEDDELRKRKWEDAFAYLHAHGKRMKHATGRVVRLGQRCMDELHNVLHEEEMEQLALKKARDECGATINALHQSFAQEIQAREDALAEATASKDKAIAESMSEVARLQDALLQQQKQAAADLAQARADAAADIAAGLGVRAEDSLNMIIDDTIKFFKDKLTSINGNAMPAAVPKPPLKPTPTIWIKQQNTNPSYLTVRAIEYKGKKWFFDAANKHMDPSAADNMIEIHDLGAICELEKLGTFTAVRKTFKPIVGSTCIYSHNGHSYKVEVVREVKPWEQLLYEQKTKNLQTTAGQSGHLGQNIGQKMLLDGPFFAPSDDQVDRYANGLNTNQELYEVVGHKRLAELATLWSSYSQAFEYNEQLTTLWVKPKWLCTWLNTLKGAKGDHEIRVVGHGVKSGDFDSLGKDERGFNLAMCSQGCRAKGDGSTHGFGIYVSIVDCIPAEYTKHSQQHPDGTFVLGLLQVPKPGTAAHKTSESTRTSRDAYQTANGALEFYHLGFSKMSNYLAGSSNDAYNVRDQTLFLPLGKVVGK